MAIVSSVLSSGSPLSQVLRHPVLSRDVVDGLRDGLSTCRSTRALSSEARSAILAACRYARRESWTPEQLLVAIKECCYSSPEISRMVTASERDGFVSRIITLCIHEFFRPDIVD
ncbi:MAG TPA: hypothetical protein VM939_12540 [Gemmatimonadaceae bacterium]|nr:hypothetical protein [Gemmatimonadaceae bacterium]